MRGKAKDDVDPPERIRITPAYAGKSSGTGKSTSLRKDHPRLCGEKFLFNNVHQNFRGSPPPMRGKVEMLNPIFDFGRITPAYAGKSIIMVDLPRIIKDHPRLCGEKRKISLSSLGDRGSPPPMRGKAEVMQTMTDLIRITPAYAGKSNTITDFRKVKGDHPRLCGEKSKRQ